MKLRNKLLCLTLTLLCTFIATDAMAKPKLAKVYVFGVSTSYTDSLTYITDIQELYPAYIESKTGFLYDRSIYSQQLQIWVENAKGRPATTCTIFFSKSRSKIDKKLQKVQKRVRKDQSTKLQELGAGEFKFTPIEWSEHEML